MFRQDPGVQGTFRGRPCAPYAQSFTSPFDDEIGGGGREEVKFLRQAIDLLVPGGILVQVCPVNQVFGSSQMCELLDIWFDQLELFLFPDDLPVVHGVRSCSAAPSQDCADSWPRRSDTGSTVCAILGLYGDHAVSPRSRPE